MQPRWPAGAGTLLAMHWHPNVPFGFVTIVVFGPQSWQPPRLSAKGMEGGQVQPFVAALKIFGSVQTLWHPFAPGVYPAAHTHWPAEMTSFAPQGRQPAI